MMKKLNNIQKLIVGELGLLLVFWTFFSEKTIIWMSENAVVCPPYPFEMSEITTIQLIIISIAIPFLTLFAFHKELK